MPYLDASAPSSLSLHFMRLNQGLTVLGPDWGSTNCIAQSSQIQRKLSCLQLILQPSTVNSQLSSSPLSQLYKSKPWLQFICDSG